MLCYQNKNTVNDVVNRKQKIHKRIYVHGLIKIELWYGWHDALLKTAFEEAVSRGKSLMCMYVYVLYEYIHIYIYIYIHTYIYLRISRYCKTVNYIRYNFLQIMHLSYRNISLIFKTSRISNILFLNFIFF